VSLEESQTILELIEQVLIGILDHWAGKGVIDVALFDRFE
jgi:hypothetical protein